MYLRGTPMLVDFNILNQAKTDGNAAGLLRHRFQLDTSKTGRVFCDAAECQERLNEGQLPPVLSAKQFARISQGLPYGDHDDAGPDSIIGVDQPPAATRSPYTDHPEWNEFAQLSEPVREALRGDFKNFLFLKRRGQLQTVIDGIYDQLARDAKARTDAADRRALEQRIQDAPVHDL